MREIIFNAEIYENYLIYLYREKERTQYYSIGIAVAKCIISLNDLFRDTNSFNLSLTGHSSFEAEVTTCASVLDRSCCRLGYQKIF